MMKRLMKMLLLCGALIGLSGCTALTNIESASKPLDVYELRPVMFDPVKPARGSRSLLVETPTASGTFVTDRIVVKPSDLEVKYLPGARWTEDAPVHFQRLLAASLTNGGRFGLVVLSDAGLSPDYVLLSDLSAFHATLPADQAAPITVSVKVTLTLMRDDDQKLLGTRTFASETTALSNDPAALVPAFDAALQTVLRDGLEWVGSRVR